MIETKYHKLDREKGTDFIMIETKYHKLVREKGRFHND